MLTKFRLNGNLSNLQSLYLTESLMLNLYSLSMSSTIKNRETMRNPVFGISYFLFKIMVFVYVYSTNLIGRSTSLEVCAEKKVALLQTVLSKQSMLDSNR